MAKTKNRQTGFDIHTQYTVTKAVEDTVMTVYFKVNTFQLYLI
jgi:hypothetical protein